MYSLLALLRVALSEGYDSGGPSSKRTFNEAETDHHEKD